jgi:hypothetical protein
LPVEEFFRQGRILLKGWREALSAAFPDAIRAAYNRPDSRRIKPIAPAKYAARVKSGAETERQSASDNS